MYKLHFQYFTISTFGEFLNALSLIWQSFGTLTILRASQLLNAELTASWEKGLSMVAQGTIVKDEYLTKLETFITNTTNSVKGLSNYMPLTVMFGLVDQCYKK